jgi:hypothetical protein
MLSVPVLYNDVIVYGLSYTCIIVQLLICIINTRSPPIESAPVRRRRIQVAHFSRHVLVHVASGQGANSDTVHRAHSEY